MPGIVEKKQNTPSLPLCFDPVRLENGLFCVSPVPYLQYSREITFLHTHEYCEFGRCSEGAGVFLAGGKIIPFQRGDCMFIAAGEPHLATSLQNTVSKWHWLYVDESRLLYQEPDLADLSGFKGPDFRNCFREEERPEETGLIREMFECALSPDASFRRQRLSALLLLFSIALHRKCKECRGESEPDILRIKPALNEMLTHYRDIVSIEKLASNCSLSANQFRRVFGKAVGRSPQEYLNNLRITMASSMLLRAELTISEVALQCGFPTISSFNRQFRLLKGTSPGKFRAENRGKV